MAGVKTMASAEVETLIARPLVKTEGSTSRACMFKNTHPIATSQNTASAMRIPLRRREVDIIGVTPTGRIHHCYARLHDPRPTEMMPSSQSVVLLGATGAVGSQVAHELAQMSDVEEVTLLGRRPLEGVSSPKIKQAVIDVFDPASYQSHLADQDVAICTLGVGQPSKMDREDFVRIDKTAVLRFATACKQAGVRHFELLGSVGADPRSRSFYLRTKGELEEGLTGLEFHRLSLFRPSMILTPTNRYGLTQAMTLAIWPLLRPLLVGGARKYRGIEVAHLGRAMARNLSAEGEGVEVLHWDAITHL